MADEVWTIGKAPTSPAAPAEETWTLGGPSGVQPQRGLLDRAVDAYKRAALEGTGGTIARAAYRAAG